MPAVAVTDTGNLFGALEVATTCAAAGIQPIIGCEIALERILDAGRHAGSDSTTVRVFFMPPWTSQW